MKVVYSFHGTLPSYCVPTVKQLRFFFDGDIYFILNDLESPFIQELQSYNVKIVDYADVEDKTFTDLQKKFHSKFCYCDKLVGREELFLRSMERFYLLHNLMKNENLSDVFFMELDNLIYNNPGVWLESFSKKDMAYMYDNHKRCSTGICYVKNTDILKMFMDLVSHRIEHSDEFLNEMTFLYYFWQENKERVQILPTHWPSDGIPQPTYENYEHYTNTIFDSLPIGILIAGVDPVHSNGVLTRGLKSIWSEIDYTKYTFNWMKTESNLWIPCVWNNKELIRINNLHVHSKDLLPYLSDAIQTD